MTTHDLPVIAAVDGSTHSWQALDWATHEAVRRRLPLLIVHVRPLARTADEETQLREADELLAEAVRRSQALAPALTPSTLAPLDFPRPPWSRSAATRRWSWSARAGSAVSARC